MRIAMVGQKGIPAIYGGIERHVEELSRELVKQGHEVLVYARHWYTPELIKNFHGIRVVHLPTIHTKHLDAIVHTFLSTLHAIRTKAEVIHFHGVGPALMAFLPRLLSPKTKVIATFHCIDRYHQKWGAFARLMLALGERAACVFPHETIGVSKNIQKYCLNEYQKITTYIPNGVAVAKPGGSAELDKWNLTPNKYILMVSRLVRHKGAHYLLEAWQIVRRLNPAWADYKLVIAGGSAFTDSYIAELKNIARGDSSVIFTDWQNGQALDELYANCALLVHPSENEGLPITVLQAMSFGRPVLVSDIPEHQEVVTDSRFWFANANITSLSQKIYELLDQPELLKNAGEKNRQVALAKYNWRDIGQKTSELYQQPLAVPVKKIKMAEVS